MGRRQKCARRVAEETSQGLSLPPSPRRQTRFPQCPRQGVARRQIDALDSIGEPRPPARSARWVRGQFPMSDLEKQRDVSSVPPANLGKVPSLDHEQTYGGGRFKDLDAEIERELQEAMGGMSDTDMYGEPSAKPKGQATPESSRKKGRILSVHGPDVFVDVPGGRSQGILPVTQFPEGLPQVGAEVEFHIEGYDKNNGLLLLSRQGAAVEADWSSVAVGQIVEARV